MVIFALIIMFVFTPIQTSVIFVRPFLNTVLNEI